MCDICDIERTRLCRGCVTIPRTAPPAPVNSRGVRMWGSRRRPGPGQPRQRRVSDQGSSPLIGRCQSLLATHWPVSQPLNTLLSLGPVQAHGTNPDDWLSRVSLQMHLQSAAVKTGTVAAVEQVADCSDSGGERAVLQSLQTNLGPLQCLFVWRPEYTDLVLRQDPVLLQEIFYWHY